METKSGDDADGGRGKRQVPQASRENIVVVVVGGVLKMFILHRVTAKLVDGDGWLR